MHRRLQERERRVDPAGPAEVVADHVGRLVPEQVGQGGVREVQVDHAASSGR